RLRPGDDRPPARLCPAVRDRCRPRAGARARRAVPDAREPRRAARPGDRHAHRDQRHRAAAGAAGRGGCPAVPRLRGRRGAVAHNARFDLAFLDAETMRLTGRRVEATSVDTVGLARRLLGRQPANLAALSYRFATDARPCHRALPDAEATAEILLRLIGMAQERGARTVGDLVELAATRPRLVQRKRSLAFGAPQQPGVYLFRDAHDQVLYVGRARDLRARLRSYFRSDRQRPAVEAALGALER